MRVCVTGGSSLIGVAVTALIAGRGDDVRCFQRHRSERLNSLGVGRDGPIEPGGRIEQVLGDITDPEAVGEVLAGCDAVVHLAAKVGFHGERADFVAVNVDGTSNVLDGARRHGIDRVVHVSSPSVAHRGEAIVGDVASEAITDHGSAWYPATKAQAERVALASASSTLGVVVVRPHLVWGPGDTQLVGRIVERSRSGRLALVAGGRALVDTTYIDNAATALVAALDAVAPHAQCSGRAYVISNGEPRPIREMVEGICLAAGVDTRFRDVPLPVAQWIGSLVQRLWPHLGSDDEPPLTRFLADQLGTAHWFDLGPARVELGWEPTVTIDEGLRRLAESYRADDVSL